VDEPPASTRSPDAVTTYYTSYGETEGRTQEPAWRRDTNRLLSKYRTR
jgi:hypothetical protein